MKKPFYHTDPMKKRLNNCPVCGSNIQITMYHCPECDTSIEGSFTGCSFCRLNDDDRLFALIFIQTEGNMKDVERVMGISYPTVKARLAKLNAALSGDQSAGEFTPFVPPEAVRPELKPEERIAILDRISSGEITAGEARRMLKGEAVESIETESESGGNDDDI